MTLADQSLESLTLHVGRMSAHDMDLPAVLGRICTALPAATGAAGAVVLVTEPSDEEPTVVASDAQAGWIGEAQRWSGSGPLPGVARSGRLLHTPDLTRLGPPELAAAAAESGLTSSLVVPFTASGEHYGGLQLLGGPWRPVEPAHAGAVEPLVAALVARLVDLRALRRLGERAAPVPAFEPVDAADVATTAIPAVRPPVPVPVPMPVPVPEQRRPAPARHRRPDGDDRRLPAGPPPGQRRPPLAQRFGAG